MRLFGSLALVCLLMIGVVARARSGARRRDGDEVAGARSGNSSAPAGTFKARDGSRCSWTVSREETVSLRVRCRAGRRELFTCEYVGEPAACAAYGSSARRYWRQIERVLAKQERPCAGAVLRAGACARAPPAAHLRLKTTTSITTSTTPETPPIRSTTPETTTLPTTNTGLPERAPECPHRADHSRLAEEKCGQTWSSICAFMFTIIQSAGDC